MASLDLSPDSVAAAISAQFGELLPVEVTYLGEGYDSTAFDVNGRWVFRFPKRADVEQQLALESAVLPRLGARIEVPIPSYSFHGVPSSAFPRHFVGYRKLAGVPAIGLDPARIPFVRLAPVLARFLASLHSFPADTAKRLGAPVHRFEEFLEEVRAEALNDLHVIGWGAPEIPEKAVRSLLEAAVSPARMAPAVVHSDLAAEHVLLDPETGDVTGIIDWSEIAVGDPAIDFAGMFHWGGPDFLNAVLTHYSGVSDAGLPDRARFFAAARGIGDLVFGRERQRPEYVSAGARALRWCLDD